MITCRFKTLDNMLVEEINPIQEISFKNSEIHINNGFNVYTYSFNNIDFSTFKLIYEENINE